MTVSIPGEVAEHSTPRRSARKAPGQLTPAQAAVLAYSEARRARGLAPLQSCGEGAAAYAAAARERGPASTPRRRAVCFVEDFFLGAATEVRPRVRSVQAHTYAAPQRRHLFKTEEAPPPPQQPAARESCDALAGAGVAEADAAREPRLHLSLRLDDTDSAVLCELLLVQTACVDDALAAELAAGLSLRGAPTPHGGAPAPEDVPSVRLARLRAPVLTHEVQRMSYLGNCAELRAHLAKRGANTLSTAAVRR